MNINSKRFHVNLGMVGIIMSLAWPTMLEQMMQTAVQYIDTAMVGSLGTRATAAVGATSTINWLISGTIASMGIGFLAYIAKSCGAGDQAGAKQAVAQSVLAVMVVGIFFTVLTLGLSSYVPVWMQVDEEIRQMTAIYFFILYAPMLPRTASIIFGTVLRAAGDTKTPMKVGLIVNIINVILNFLLIYPTRRICLFGGQNWIRLFGGRKWISLFSGQEAAAGLEITIWGADLGVIGAALASAIAFTVGGICITVALWRQPLVSPRGQSFRPNVAILRPCMKVAIPNMFQRFGTSLGYVAFASMINSLGEVATAAHTIANTVESAFYIPGYGMQTAAATLAGNAYGAKDRKRMKELAGMFIPIEIILMIFSGGALFVLAKPLMGLFSTSAEVIALGTMVLRMVAVSEPFYGFSIIIEGMMQGVGKTREPFIYNILGMWGIRIVGTYICTQHLGMGLISAWACMIAHNMLLFVCFLICYVRGSWNPLWQADSIEEVKDFIKG